MKSIKIASVLILLLVVISSCRKGSIWGIHGKGPNKTETRKHENFQSIDLRCDGNITYRQDSVYKVEITAQENIVGLIETKVVDSELRFEFLREIRIHDAIEIVVHSPSLTAVVISGSGNFKSNTTLKTNDLNLIVSGSGNITIPTLSCTTMQNTISGSGNISLNAGTGNNASYKISGSGNVYASGFMVKNADVTISGSGNVSLYATDKLDVTASGSGDVRYKGNPLITSKITGSGRLIAIN